MSTPSRALVLSSSRTPRQQQLMSGTSGRNQLDAQAICTNGLSSGRRVLTPQTGNRSLSTCGSLSPMTSQYYASDSNSIAAGVSSAQRAPVDPAGAGGLIRGVRKVYNQENRAAAAANGSGGLPDRVDKRMLRKLDGTGGHIRTNLGEVDPAPRFGGKKCERPQTAPRVNNVFKNETSPVRRSEEIDAEKQSFRKVTSPKPRDFTFAPTERVDKRDPEARVMNSGSIPRKTRKTAFAGRVGLTAQQAATPPWV